MVKPIASPFTEPSALASMIASFFRRHDDVAEIVFVAAVGVARLQSAVDHPGLGVGEHRVVHDHAGIRVAVRLDHAGVGSLDTSVLVGDHVDIPVQRRDRRLVDPRLDPRAHVVSRHQPGEHVRIAARTLDAGRIEQRIGDRLGHDVGFVELLPVGLVGIVDVVRVGARQVDRGAPAHVLVNGTGFAGAGEP
ncbi:MAG: hypothetical protein M5U09_14655 [Gammaproteobacteria bacterium]|nr:hypothetical protein [Gammaproteobacteria bacterium]